MHGASHRDEFVYDSELRRSSEEHPQVIQYLSSVSRPSAARNAEWNGPVGRINTILDECLIRWSPPKEDTVIYLCGNPGMIDDAKARLLPGGWSVAQEQYWQQRKRG
jgi:NAD(P)H-flavin reductase